MNAPLGPNFYEWWAGLSRAARYATAAVIAVSAGLLAYFDAPGTWWLWGPLALVGGLLLLLAGEMGD